MGPMKEGAGNSFTASAMRVLHDSREENGNTIDHKDFSLTVVHVKMTETEAEWETFLKTLDVEPG